MVWALVYVVVENCINVAISKFKQSSCLNVGEFGEFSNFKYYKPLDGKTLENS